MAIAAVRRRRYVAALLRCEPELSVLGSNDIASVSRLFIGIPVSVQTSREILGSCEQQ